MVDSSDWAFHQATQTAIGKKYALKKLDRSSSDIVTFKTASILTVGVKIRKLNLRLEALGVGSGNEH